MVPVRLDDSLIAGIDARAQREGSNRSAVIRSALAAHLSDNEPSPARRLSLTRDQRAQVRESVVRRALDG